MDVYILDENLRRSEVVEQFESMIWTERYSAYGDFQLDIDPTIAESGLFQQGTPIAIDKSERVMVVDSVERQNKDDGNKILVVKGKSLEAVLDQRPNQYAAFGAGTAPVEQVWGPTAPKDTPGNIIRSLVDDFCRTNTVIPADKIPFLVAGTHSSYSGVMAEYSSAVTVRSDLDTLYNSVKNIADVYRLGFRLVWVEGTDVLGGANPSKLYFEVYPGFDRTTAQTALAPVIFSEALDTLTDSTELTATSGWKNMAYVSHSLMTRIVYAPGIDPGIAGFDRKVLLVDANDIQLTGTALQTAMDQRGREELAKADITIAFDGTINNTVYVYGTHYKLGDMVEQRSESGVTNAMRVTEQIFVSDTNGEKSYPTLVLNSTVNPGTWVSIAAGKVWYDYTTEVWATV